MLVMTHGERSLNVGIVRGFDFTAPAPTTSSTIESGLGRGDAVAPGPAVPVVQVDQSAQSIVVPSGSAQP